MYEVVNENGYFDMYNWFFIIDVFGIMCGVREQFVDIVGVVVMDVGILVQSVNFLFYILIIIIKFGFSGVLFMILLEKGDFRIRDFEYVWWVVSRILSDYFSVGGVYMRMFLVVERVKEEDIVSVNGIGDMFIGVLIVGLVRGGEVEELIDIV